MLTPDQVERIRVELVFALPPSLVSQEALAMRREIAAHLAELEKAGIAVEVSCECLRDDDFPPLAAPATDTGESLFSLRRPNTDPAFIRANLAASWAFGLQWEAEENEEKEAQAQCERALFARIDATPLLSPAQREAFLLEIATLTNAGRIDPYHARRLTRAVHGNKPKRKRKRKR